MEMDGTATGRPARLEALEDAVRAILRAVGEDPKRPGLLETPARVARMYEEILSGVQSDPAAELVVTPEDTGSTGPVVVRDIPFYSMCEHHLLPFMGRAHVAYLPAEGRLTGLSRLVRVVDGFARRPQVQERLTEQVASALESRLRPRGVAVVLEAQHLCMLMRGVRAEGSSVVTVALRGVYAGDDAARERILALLVRPWTGRSTSVD